MSNGINPYYASGQNPMFSNPYATGGGYQPSGGGGGGGWIEKLFGAAAAGGPVGAAIGVGGSLLSGLLGGIFGGKSQEEQQKELLEMQQKERAKYRKESKGAYGKAQSEYQRMASGLFPELPRDAFVYKNPMLDQSITNALMSRMGNFFADWGVPEGRRKGGNQMSQQFLGNMNFNPYQAPAQPDVSFSPAPVEQSAPPNLAAIRDLLSKGGGVGLPGPRGIGMGGRGGPGMQFAF